MITKKQLIVLKEISDYIKDFGYSPTFVDLAKRLDIKWTNTAYGQVCSLQRKGYITLVPKISRSIRLTDKGKEAISDNKKICKYINEHGNECYKNVELTSHFSADLFHKIEHHGIHYDERFALNTNLGSFTVVDRVTGFIGSPRDVESGFRDTNDNFWLASGNCDVRDSNANTIGEAIRYIKSNANTCVPILDKETINENL